jgi:hypothetical protein
MEAGRGRPAEHRARLAELGRLLRVTEGPVEGPWPLFRELADALFEERHGAGRETHRRLAAAERAQRQGAPHAEVRRALAEAGRSLRAERRGEGSALDGAVRDRFHRAVAITRYQRALAGERFGGESSVEIETQLTDSLIAMFRMKRPGRDGGPIGDLLKNRRLVRPSKLSRWRRRRREARKARLEEKVRELDPSVSFDRLPEPQQELKRSLERMLVEDWYDRARSSIERLAKERRVRPRKLTWDEVGKALGPETLRDLLVGALAGRSDFERDRALPLVEVAKELRTTMLSNALTLGDQQLEPGEQQLVPPFARRAEYRSAESTRNFDGVELHRRVRGPAGVTSTQTFELMWSLGSKMRHQHVHVPFDARVHRLDRPGSAEALADHWRRANLFGELLAARRTGELTPRRWGERTLFDYSSGTKVADLYRHLTGRLSLLRPAALKTSTVGYRIDLYTGPDGKIDRRLHGYEVRAIVGSPGEPQEQRRYRETWLDALQRTLASGDYGIPRSRWKRYLANEMPDHPADRARALEALHYNRADVLDRGPAELAPFLTDRVKGIIEGRGHESYGLRMLVHDFSRDTIWLTLPEGEREAARQRVLDAQRRALQALEQGIETPRVVKDFALSSGLLEQTGRSLGMDVPGP